MPHATAEQSPVSAWIQVSGRFLETLVALPTAVSAAGDIV
jgi:hypothetical protein